MITVEVDTETASRWLRGLYASQIPFALQRAINKTALQAQTRVRELMGSDFTLRRRDWALKNVKIRREDFATKAKLQAIVRMEAPGDGSRTDILAKFEKSGVKKPHDGGRLAVPVDVRTSRVTIIRKNERPRSLDFVHKGGVVWQGKKRTFMIRKPDGTGGIYQRTGKKGTKRRRGEGRRLASDVVTRRTRDMNVRILYRFTPLARIEGRLHFEDTARRVILQVWDANFAEAFEHAMRTTR